MPCLPEGEEGKSTFNAVSLNDCKITCSQFWFTHRDNVVWRGLHLACSLLWHTCAKNLRVEQGSVSTPSGPVRLNVLQLWLTHMSMTYKGCSLQITTRLWVSTALVPTKYDENWLNFSLIGLSIIYFSLFLSFLPLFTRAPVFVCVCVCSYTLLSLGLTENIFIFIFVDCSATDIEGDGGW